MEIEALAATIPVMNLGTEIGARVMKLSMDTMKTAGEGMKKMMEMSVNPEIGGNIDISL